MFEGFLLRFGGGQFEKFGGIFDGVQDFFSGIYDRLKRTYLCNGSLCGFTVGPETGYGKFVLELLTLRFFRGQVKATPESLPTGPAVEL